MCLIKKRRSADAHYWTVTLSNTPSHDISSLFQFDKIHYFWACAFSQPILGGKQTFSQWKMTRHCAVTGCSNGKIINPISRVVI